MTKTINKKKTAVNVLREEKVKEVSKGLKQIRPDNLVNKIMLDPKIGNRKGSGHSKGSDLVRFQVVKSLPVNKVIETKDLKGLQTRRTPVIHFSESPKRILEHLYYLDTKKRVKVVVNPKDPNNEKGHKYSSFLLVPCK